MSPANLNPYSIGSITVPQPLSNSITLLSYFWNLCVSSVWLSLLVSPSIAVNVVPSSKVIKYLVPFSSPKYVPNAII